MPILSGLLTSKSKEMIKAAIFDMDGLLIDSEPFWQETERKIFSEYGIHLTPAMQKNTFGLRTDEQIKYWYNYKPWPDPDFEKTENQYDQIIIEYFRTRGKLLQGAMEIIDFFKTEDYRLALASSSRMCIIEAFLQKFNLHEIFEVVHSAEYEKYGKPHPAVYLHTAKLMKLSPWSCLAFEDSLHGVIAAKAARMKVVAVPDHNHFDYPEYGIADLKLRSLSEFGKQELNKLSFNE